MKRRLYLTRNDISQVEIDSNLQDARASCKILSVYGWTSWTDALPLHLFKGVETQEEILEIFDLHHKDVEQICSINWDKETK